MGLTQEAFSSRFQIPLGTLRDWEQGRAAPDQTARAYLPAPICPRLFARAYLKVIAGDPDAVRRALDKPAPMPPG